MRAGENKNKLGLYRQCVGARKGGGWRQRMFADALPIQPVVLSRDTLIPLMEIVCSSVFGGRLWMVVWPRSASLPGLLEVDGGVNWGRRMPTE